MNIHLVAQIYVIQRGKSPIILQVLGPKSKLLDGRLEDSQVNLKPFPRRRRRLSVVVIYVGS